MSNPGQPIPLVGEADSMHPTPSHGGVAELGHQLADGHLLSPSSLTWTLLYVLDESREHSNLEVS